MRRSMKAMSIALVVLGTAISTSGRVNATIIDPTFSAAGSSNLNTDTSLFDPTNPTLNGGGLSHDVITGDTLASAQTATFNGGYGFEWETNSNGSGYYFGSNPAPVFVWNLGSQVTLANIVLWQSDLTGNGNQLADFSLRFSNSASFSGASFSGTLAADTNLSQTFNLGGASGQYVEMTLLSNHTEEQNGSDRVGFGQIRFDTVATPEPSSILLGVVAVAGTLAVARRRKAVTA